MRCGVFCVRNLKEMLRDAVTYVFSIALPVVLIVMFHFINSAIKAPEVTFYAVDNIMPGVLVFGYWFLTLNCSVLIAKDKETAFFARLLTTPITDAEFVLGYALPMLIVALLQTFACYLTAILLGLGQGVTFAATSLLVAFIMLLPTVLLAVWVGVIIGMSARERVAPGVSSAIINVAALLGGAWFDVGASGGLRTVCSIFPFYHSVRAARLAVGGCYQSALIPFFITLGWSVAAGVAAILVFRFRKNK